MDRNIYCKYCGDCVEDPIRNEDICTTCSNDLEYDELDYEEY